ncbi:MAG: hypothetical protein M3Q29_22105 [Chloroflexota bacterium]|nr:hypothetical protein [Chloroflexota bacterium]
MALKERIEEHLSKLLAFVKPEESYGAFSRALDKLRTARVEEGDDHTLDGEGQPRGD